MDQQAQQPMASAPMPTQPAKKGGFSSFLIKTLFVVITAGLLVFGGYYFGKISKSPASVVPTPIPTQTLISPSSPISPTSTSKKTKTIKGGLKDGSTSFKPYIIEVPLDWTDTSENSQTGAIDKLTLSKNGYTLTIYQAAIGGGGCLYPGDAPKEMAQTFTDFVEIKGVSETYRRSWNQSAAKTLSYTICQKATDGSYGSLTSYGAISAASPNPAEKSILAEIDSMLASLIKK